VVHEDTDVRLFEDGDVEIFNSLVGAASDLDGETLCNVAA
jgi:hypothetical protein